MAIWIRSNEARHSGDRIGIRRSASTAPMLTESGDPTGEAHRSGRGIRVRLGSTRLRRPREVSVAGELRDEGSEGVRNVGAEDEVGDAGLLAPSAELVGGRRRFRREIGEGTGRS